jgi:predicted nucleotide-binding protein
MGTSLVVDAVSSIMDPTLPMKKFDGGLELLKELVATSGPGEWTDIEHGHQFRAKSGATLNWYPSTGTVSYGGPRPAKAALMEALEKGSGPSVDDAFPAANTTPAPTRTPARIFVVHGHDEQAREQLELVLHRLGLQPYVLANSGGSGLTIIEALEREIVERRTGVDFGIVLMTPDDKGYSDRDGSRATQPRARQNVVLEMGMMLAALGRPRVAVLRKGHLEAPSDANGIIYIPFNKHVRETVPKLVDRLREAGFDLRSDAITSASS